MPKNDYGTCACGKVKYPSRAVAKSVARRVYPHDNRLRPYRCGEWWHLGHLAPAVLHGRYSRQEVYYQ